MSRHIIAVCGAGGKTTLCNSLAKYYVNKKKKVCILTTTHMWANVMLSDISNINIIEAGKIYYFGKIDGMKITYVGDTDYNEICKKFDYVIIEADGSKSMPIKIPNHQFEPVIPNNVTDIIVVAGLSAINRELGSVCQRYEVLKGIDNFTIKNKLSADTIVTKKIIDELVNHYYIEYLQKKYNKAKLYKCYVDITKYGVYKNIYNVAISICASGFSKRFGVENKLFSKIGDKCLYEIMVDKIISAKNIVLNKFKEELKYNDLNIEIAIVSKYDEILEDKKYFDKVSMIRNDNANIGLSNSVKLSVNKYYDYDAIMFINCDLPVLPENEIANFLFNSICCNTNISSVYTDAPKNPAYFEKEYFDKILLVEGDKGPREILDKYKMKTYKYHINEKYLFDIDTKEDLNRIKARTL